jgi:HAD superfamily 5'-nucleotidase-like hydrolase
MAANGEELMSRTRDTAEVAPTPVPTADYPAERGIFCNRTLNLRSTRAVGYDMDYTLVHYRAQEGEKLAFGYARRVLGDRGWPVDDLKFEARQVIRGLTFDLELGNLVKPNRFGYVMKAAHGTRVLDFDEQRRAYAGRIVDLSEDRFVFLNTLFSHSEASLFAQLVDRVDQHELPGVLGYAELYQAVRNSIDAVHMEGSFKAEIIADPERFVEHDPELPLALLDQRHAGKKLLLITNSEWDFTRSMMSYAFDRFLPDGMTWRDLFHTVIVSARKPDFFFRPNPMYEVVEENLGLLRPHFGAIRKGGVYFGGSAAFLEKQLGVSGDEILFVGDHLYGDVHVSKAVHRWRTALILRELEEELRDLRDFEETQKKLREMMEQKETIEAEICRRRLVAQRARDGYGPTDAEEADGAEARLTELREQFEELDERIAPLAQSAAELGNPIWGSLMRAGNDKSLYARQVERYADIYTSRVSNFVYQTPFAYWRAPRGSLPHDPG